MSPRVAVMLRTGDHYKANVFCEGLRRHGFVIDQKWKRAPRPEDAILLWNRTRAWEAIADIYERAGARVIVAENGYTRPEHGKFYALALDRHNGAGRWLVGDRPRHTIPEQPWRESGEHVLVLPQRGIGSPGVAMPSTWGRDVVKRLQRMTTRPVILRPHPGHKPHPRATTLEEQLRGAHCAVTWGSGAGVKALQAGVPVFHELGRWIAAPAARLLAGDLEDCDTPDRRLAWTRISWAQWTLEEIESGEAFDGLLNAPRRDLFCTEQQSVPDYRAGDVRRRAPGGCEPRAQAVAQL